AWAPDRTFESPPGYPRLTDYGLGTTQAEASRYTGTAVRPSLAHKYQLNVDAAYFYRNFRDTGTRFGYSEYVTADKIPRLYFDRVAPPPAPPAPHGARRPPPAPPVVPAGARPAGKQRPRATEGTTLAPVEPPARTAEGEIPRPTPRSPTTAGGGGGGGGGGPGVVAGRGAPVAPITVPEPAARLNKVGGPAQAVGAALVAAQLSSLRGAEVQKAVNKLDQLAPTIQDFRERGYAVAVTLVVEAPNQIDIAALMAGIGDPGQVVYFKDMYISGV